jgi:hypothetical protein
MPGGPPSRQQIAEMSPQEALAWLRDHPLVTAEEGELLAGAELATVNEEDFKPFVPHGLRLVTDAEGRPVAAQIPWDEFEAIRDRLDEDGVSAEWSEEIAKRVLEIEGGEVELVDGEDFLQRLRVV